MKNIFYSDDIYVYNNNINYSDSLRNFYFTYFVVYNDNISIFR